MGWFKIPPNPPLRKGGIIRRAEANALGGRRQGKGSVLAQISSTVMASSGQTETHDSHPRQSAGLATLVSLSSASSTSAGQTSIHSPHDLHLSSAIFGKYIETPLNSSYESIHIEVCFLECCESIAEPDQLVGPFDVEFDLRAIHLAVVGAKEPGVMASSAKRILHQ
jgi:hypothetical protein